MVRPTRICLLQLVELSQPCSHFWWQLGGGRAKVWRRFGRLLCTGLSSLSIVTPWRCCAIGRGIGSSLCVVSGATGLRILVSQGRGRYPRRSSRIIGIVNHKRGFENGGVGVGGSFASPISGCKVFTGFLCWSGPSCGGLSPGAGGWGSPETAPCRCWRLDLRVESCSLPRLLLGDGAVNCALDSLPRALSASSSRIIGVSEIDMACTHLKHGFGSWARLYSGPASAGTL
jgi:hypothetical protein